jgi:hypothetical protein
MVAGVTGFLVIHLILLSMDEFRFHRSRGPVSRERMEHGLTALVTAALFAVIVVLTFNDWSKFIGMGLAVIMLFLVARGELWHGAECSTGERVLHAVLAIFAPLVLLIGIGMWPLIHGVSVIVGLALPFDPEKFLPIYLGYAVLMGLLAGVQLKGWKASRKVVPVVSAETQLEDASQVGALPPPTTH